jgi:CheY-like chemotaxis protein
LEKPVNRSGLFKTLHWVFGNEEPLAEHEQPIVEQVANYSSSRVLLVEDNAINRQVALGFLADTLVEVEVAENGLIAIEKIQRQHFDLVLMDIQMPQMDGLTATKEIRGRLNKTVIPVVAMTAHAMAEDIEASLAAGMNAHITKPIDPQILYRVMADHLKPCETEVEPSTSVEELVLVVNESGDVNEPGSEAWFMAALEQVNGIDATVALAKMNGRTTLYLGLVRDFEQQQQNLAQLLLGMFDDQQWQVLYRSVHSLKSNAAYIGAYRMAELAQNLETGLGQGEHNKEALLELCQLLKSILNQLSGVYPQQSEPELVKFSKRKLRKRLLQILPLLQKSDLEVEEQLPALVRFCQGSQYAQAVNELIELIDDVEYEQSVVKAQGLIDDISI